MDTFKDFIRYQDVNASPGEYAKRYEEYKMKYESKLGRAFFEDHKLELWLQERYSPAIKARAEKEKCIQKAITANEFLEKVKSGEYKFSFDQVDVEKEDSEFSNGSIRPNRLVYIRRIPCTCPDAALHDAVKNATGSDYIAIYFSDPAKKNQNDFDRSAWILYPSPESAMQATTALQNVHVMDNKMMRTPLSLQATIFRERHPILTPSFMSNPVRITHDLEKAVEVAKLLDQYTFDDESVSTIEKVLESLPTTYTDKQKLDVTIGYLRLVHFYSYYSGVHCRDMGDMLHTHPALMVRPTLKEDDREKEKPWGQWAVNLDEKTQRHIDSLAPEKVAAKREKERAVVEEVERKEEEQLESVYKTYVEVVDDSKQRCGLCKKLFRSAEFVRKHIRNKHPELVLDRMAETGEKYMWAAFQEDPNRPKPVVEFNNASPRGDYRGRGRGRGYSSGGRGYHDDRRRYNDRGGYGGRRSPPPYRPARELPVDPRAVSTSYRDLDNLKDSKVELNFSAIGSLPPPKKKQKKT